MTDRRKYFDRLLAFLGQSSSRKPCGCMPRIYCETHAAAEARKIEAARARAAYERQCYLNGVDIQLGPIEDGKVHEIEYHGWKIPVKIEGLSEAMQKSLDHYKESLEGLSKLGLREASIGYFVMPHAGYDPGREQVRSDLFGMAALYRGPVVRDHDLETKALKAAFDRVDMKVHDGWSRTGCRRGRRER